MALRSAGELERMSSRPCEVLGTRLFRVANPAPIPSGVACNTRLVR